jgi:alpha-D-ribose 1-methylphosphonate 5-triphosphate synthase subunit PhnG
MCGAQWKLVRQRHHADFAALFDANLTSNADRH